MIGRHSHNKSGGSHQTNQPPTTSRQSTTHQPPVIKQPPTNHQSAINHPPTTSHQSTTHQPPVINQPPVNHTTGFNSLLGCLPDSRALQVSPEIAAVGSCKGRGAFCQRHAGTTAPNGTLQSGSKALRASLPARARARGTQVWAATKARLRVHSDTVEHL